jgi:hypothetical protein
VLPSKFDTEVIRFPTPANAFYFFLGVFETRCVDVFFESALGADNGGSVVTVQIDFFHFIAEFQSVGF